MLGKSFIATKADQSWKEKRKASGHAFYKDRMGHMMDTLKKTIMISINRWMDEMAKSTDGTYDIDIDSEFMSIFARNIITISFGEDVSDEKFEI